MFHKWLAAFSILVGFTLFCPTFTLPALADDQPILSVARASLAAGVDYANYTQEGVQALPDFRKSFEVGLFAAYVLTPHLTLTASGAWDVDNKWLRTKVGVRTVLWRGRD